MNLLDEKHINVDFVEKEIKSIRCSQYDKDSREYIVHFFDNGKKRLISSQEKVVLKLMKPDANPVVNYCTINEDGTVIFKLTEQICAVAGTAPFQFMLLDTNEKTIANTMPLKLIIEKGVFDNDTVTSSYEFDALLSILLEIEDIKDHLTELNTKVEINETERIKNENKRIEKEAQRDNAEKQRESQELKRQTNSDAAIKNAQEATNKANNAANNLQEKLEAHHFVLTEDKDIAGGVPSLDTNTKIPIIELYEATTKSKGITQLTDSTTSTSTTTAATPNSVKTVNDALINEINRAKSAESKLTTNLNNEVTRAKVSEKNNADTISAETTRAITKENEIATNLANEITRATGTESTLISNLNAEITRSKKAEQINADNISAEITRAKAVESDLYSKKVDKTTVAEANNLGLVKSGTDITVDTSGNVSVNDNSHKHIVSNISDLTATASELNVLDGITATTTELNYVDGVISNIQTQLNSKSANGHTHDDRYYTESEIDTKVSTINSSISSHIGNKSNPHSVTKAQVGLGNVENKSSATIRGEITKSNVTTALGYTPYTPNEVDNKLSALETNIDWKESVATYSDIATTYPNPVDGWTVNVKDTDYTYRYNNTSWVAISANAIPKATNSVDGLLSKEEHANYDDANSKKHTHSNKSVIDGISSTNVSNWNSAKTHASSAHAPSNAQANTIENIKVNGIALTPTSKAVDIKVPTKISQLSNDSGFITSNDIDKPIIKTDKGNYIDDSNNADIRYSYIILGSQTGRKIALLEMSKSLGNNGQKAGDFVFPITFKDSYYSVMIDKTFDTGNISYTLESNESSRTTTGLHVSFGAHGDNLVNSHYGELSKRVHIIVMGEV